MSSSKIISFADAWKNFLLMTGIPYKFRIHPQIDSDRIIQGILVDGLESRNIDGDEYFCGDKIHKDITFVFPKEAFINRLREKIFKPLLGKPYNEQREVSFKKASEKMIKNFESQKGSQIRSRIEELISKKEYWEALFSLHPILEHRLRAMLKYKCSEKNNKEIIVDSIKEKFCEEEIRTFKHLVNIVYLANVIDDIIKIKLETFNSERDNIAHNLLLREVHSQTLEIACKHGLDLMDLLEEVFTKIIPRPEIIIMKELSIKKVPY